MIHKTSTAVHIIAPLLSLMTTLCIHSTAQAQSAQCLGRGNDAFNAARRARLALEDYTFVNAQFQGDLDLMREATEVHQLKDPPRFRFYAGPMADIKNYAMMPSCSTTGTRPADLMQTRLGILVGIEELKWGLSLRYVYSDYGSTLDARTQSQFGPMDVEPPEERNKRTYKASTGQQTQALRLQLTQWFALALGQIVYNPVSLSATESGTRFTNIEEIDQGTSHNFVRLEIPIADLSLDFILGENRQNVETLYLDLRNIPLFVVPLAVSLKTAYLSDEQQTYGVVGVDWLNPFPVKKKRYEFTHPDTKEVTKSVSISQATHRVGVDLATEFNQVNLRFARIRTSMHYKLFDRKLDKLENLFIGQPYFSVELDWEASVFNSRFMQEQLDRRYVFGTSGRLSTGIGLRFMAIYFDAMVGLNRPDTLSKMVQAVDTPEAGIQLRWRIGF